MDKAFLRRTALEKRKALSETERVEKNALIKQHVESLTVFVHATNILSYFSQKQEVDTLLLMKEWMNTKQFFLPRLVSDNAFIPSPLVSWDCLEANAFGIPEPFLSPEAQATKPSLDLILVPGVAFDKNGNRIGMGKGFYDRFLKDYPGVLRVALAYSEQILDQVPKEPYDEPVDMIITEQTVIRCRV